MQCEGWRSFNATCGHVLMASFCLISLVSSQQAEINKWKSRAFKLKLKNKAEVDKPSSPCTPTKRGIPMTSDCSGLFSSPKKLLVTPKKVLDSPRKVFESPRKPLDSPKVSPLDSPKSSFFSVGGSSELLSRACPKQFFDNSGLGTLPGEPCQSSLTALPFVSSSWCHKDLSCLFCQILVLLRQRRVTVVMSLCVWGITEGSLTRAWGVGIHQSVTEVGRMHTHPSIFLVLNYDSLQLNFSYIFICYLFADPTLYFKQ